MGDPGRTEAHEGWSDFLLTFSRALQCAQMYEVTNALLVEPIAELVAEQRELHDAGCTLTFCGREGHVFADGLRVRTDGATFIRHQQFLQMLALRGMAGLTIRTPLAEAEWQVLLQELARFDRLSTAPFDEIARALTAKGLTQVELLRFDPEAKTATAGRVQIDRRVFAVRTVAKAALLLKRYIQKLEDPAEHVFYQLKLQRVLQDLVTMCLEDGWKYLGLVNNKRGDEYVYEHGVSVAVLSLAVGVRMGLRRMRLTELGMAAILHDLGKAVLPGDLMQRTDRFTPEERAVLLRESPLHGVRAVVKSGPCNEAVLKRILVICEHQSPDTESSHPFSKLTAIAERFDALTSPRPYRTALLPDDAIRKLLTLGDLDPAWVRAFVATVGLFPPGTLVRLASDELAVVFHPPTDPHEYLKPIVRIARDAAGQEVPGAPVVDLAAQDGAIESTLDPATLGLNTSYVLSQAVATS